MSDHAVKWKVFKEKVPDDMKPLWVVWDNSEEFLFQTGADALAFVRRRLDAQAKARTVARWFNIPAKWYEAADKYADGRKGE